MKKLFSLLLCLLLFSGCSQPAAEVSSSPVVEPTSTPTIDATSAPTATPTPTPYINSLYNWDNMSNIVNYHFESINDAVVKTPDDFSTEEELYEFIYQDCERRHANLVSAIKKDQVHALYLHVTLDKDFLPPELPDFSYVTVDCILTDPELLNQWKSFILNTKMERKNGYKYSDGDLTVFPTGMESGDITYCIMTKINLQEQALETHKNALAYYYPDQSRIQHLSPYGPDWDDATQKKYEEFENKIHQLAADKFKVAYDQAANYPFLN